MSANAFFENFEIFYTFDLIHLSLSSCLTSILTLTLSLKLNHHLITESGSTVAALQEGIIVATV